MIIAAPGGRGEDAMVRTAVARPAVGPVRQISVSSARTSRIVGLSTVITALSYDGIALLISR